MEKDEEEEVVENIKNNNIKRKKERKKETSRPMWSVQEQEGTKGLKDFDSELTSHETRPLMRSGGAPLQIFARMRNPVRKVFFSFPRGALAFRRVTKRQSPGARRRSLGARCPRPAPLRTTSSVLPRIY